MDIHDIRSGVAAFNQTLSMIKLLKEGVGIVVCEKCEWVQVLRGGCFIESFVDPAYPRQCYELG